MFASNPTDLPSVISDGELQVRGADHAGTKIAHFKLPAGTDLRPALKGLPGDRCPCPHWGYMISGRVRMHTEEGTHDYTTGQVFYWAPGHAPEAIEDSEYVDFSPSADMERVLKHILSGAAANA